jgi:opacity protein-like surface antigen
MRAGGNWVFCARAPDLRAQGDRRFRSENWEMKKVLLLASMAAFGGSAVSAQGFSYEIYLGTIPEDTTGLDYNGVIYPMDQGDTYGLGIYVNDFAGFEVGLDVMVTDRRYTDFVSGLETVSYMLNGRYPFELGPGFDAYVGAGVGAIDIRYDGADFYPEGTGNAVSAGGQLSAGLRYDLGIGQVFGEARYQFAFEKVEIEDPNIEYNSTALLIGVRF